MTKIKISFVQGIVLTCKFSYPISLTEFQHGFKYGLGVIKTLSD